MKILVTGGAGFIGSHLVDRLINDGHTVVVIDNLSLGRIEHVNSKAVFYKMDIRDEKLAQIFKEEQPEIVSHHAAQASVTKSMENPFLDNDVNIRGTLNILECCRNYGVKKIIFSSTGGAVYGEPQRIPVNEQHPINPLSIYGLHKYFGEKYLYLYNENYGLQYIILRYSNVYGPRQNPNGEAGVIAIFSRQLLQGATPTIFGDGNKTRDYLYVDDVIEANLLVMDFNKNGRIFNLGWGLEITDKKIYYSIKEALGVNTKPIYGSKRPGELDRIALDAMYIKKELGWQPKVILKEGIAKTVAYYKKMLSKNEP
ncbi:MAG: NAD-dependent epimerase/dehydratase family protein [Thermodesulfobacteriota bacterium]|nr:NAD-dependent epimerase/dehydratase family protein [Thermodesulfobacteriota bacterium]